MWRIGEDSIRIQLLSRFFGKTVSNYHTLERCDVWSLGSVNERGAEPCRSFKIDDKMEIAELGYKKLDLCDDQKLKKIPGKYRRNVGKKGNLKR